MGLGYKERYFLHGEVTKVLYVLAVTTLQNNCGDVTGKVLQSGNKIAKRGTYPSQRLHEYISMCGGHVALLRKSLSHAFEILSCDGSIFVKIDPSEVGLHLLNPQVGHGGRVAETDSQRC